MHTFSHEGQDKDELIAAFDKKGGSPGGEWIFVQLGAGWYVRDDGWKMNEKGELFNMKDSPFVEAPVPSDSTDPAAQAARKRLAAVLSDLNPAGGKTVPEGADDKTKAERKAKKAAQKAAAKAASK